MTKFNMTIINHIKASYKDERTWLGHLAFFLSFYIYNKTCHSRFVDDNKTLHRKYKRHFTFS